MELMKALPDYGCKTFSIHETTGDKEAWFHVEILDEDKFFKFLMPEEEINLPWQDEIFKQWLRQFREYRINVKKQKDFSNKGWNYFLRNLVDISGNNMRTACLILKQSRDQGWIGIFPLKNNNNGQTYSDLKERSARDLAAGK
jgi:hypothetical protein